MLMLPPVYWLIDLKLCCSCSFLGCSLTFCYVLTKVLLMMITIMMRNFKSWCTFVFTDCIVASRLCFHQFEAYHTSILSQSSSSKRTCWFFWKWFWPCFGDMYCSIHHAADMIVLVFIYDQKSTVNGYTGTDC